MASPHLSLWLVRHATPRVAPGTCYGRLEVQADPDHTRLTAHQLHAAWQSHKAAPETTLVWHSPARRCADLATACAQAGLPASEPKADLLEMDFGQWEGLAWDAIERTEIDAWTQHFLTHRPGGGESVDALLHRTQRALTLGLQTAQAQGIQTPIWLTHAGVIRAVECLISRSPQALNTLQAKDWPMTPCAFGSWQIHTLPPVLCTQTR